MSIEIERVPVASLVAYDANARVHSDEQLAMLGDSLRRFGWVAPVLIDEENAIIAGHGRIEAARRVWAAGLGVPGCEVDVIPCVRLANLTPVQVRALRIADNKLAQLSHFDDAELVAVLRSISDSSITPSALGFTDDEFRLLVLDEPASDLEEGAADETGTGAAGEDRYAMINFTCILARDQSRKMHAALARAVERYNAGSPGEALVAMCRAYYDMR